MRNGSLLSCLFDGDTGIFRLVPIWVDADVDHCVLETRVIGAFGIGCPFGEILVHAGLRYMFDVNAETTMSGARTAKP